MPFRIFFGSLEGGVQTVELAGNQPASSSSLVGPTDVALAGDQPAASGALTPVLLSPTYTTWAGLIREIDPADWDGTVTAYLEVHAKTSNASFAVFARLYNVTDAVEVSGSEITSTSTSEVRIRSGALTLAAGLKEYRVEFGGFTGATFTLYDAVLILEVAP